ncbi:MAG TPA: transporter substrate-binding domain-containing protein [Myxococcota bacterium]|nr:transporter substrate-binding domain-containing protein [Myxococcota bacterium]
MRVTACALACLVSLALAGPARAQLELPHGVVMETVTAKWTGDLDGMVKRRMIRVLTPYSKTHYFVDKGQQRGLVYDSALALENALNKKYKTGNLRVHMVFIPTPRDKLIPGLLDGTGDIAAAGLTVTPERLEQVDFAPPTFTNVSEIAITGPGGPGLASLDDLAGREVFVRKSSSYRASLDALNARFAQEGKKPVAIDDAPESLEDEDILEMVNAGLVKIAVVDDYLAKFWKQVFPGLVLHEDVALRTGASIAPAYRKNSPQLTAWLGEQKKTFGQGSSFANQKIQQYLKKTKFVKSATSEADINRFLGLIEVFKRYGDQYDLDWLLMLAQGYQESRLDQGAKSHVGAVGVMQVMPATGQELKVGDIHKMEPNIHAGVKYIRFMIDQYYADEPMTPLDKTLFAFASYNCGAGRMKGLRKEAAQLGLDQNVWFGNVERVASKRIGRETVTYVSNIFKYYVAYGLAVKQLEAKKKAKEEVAN